MPRVVESDNFDRDWSHEYFVSEVVTQEEAEAIVKKWNEENPDLCSPTYYRIVKDDYVLRKPC